MSLALALGLGSLAAAAAGWEAGPSSDGGPGGAALAQGASDGAGFGFVDDVMVVRAYMPPLAPGWKGEQEGIRVESLPSPAQQAFDDRMRNKGPIEFDFSQAVELPPLSAEQYAWLEPQRQHMDPGPRQHVDFTAYCLEWGEARLGLSNAAVSPLPRTQVGTIPALDALGVRNIHAKVNFLRMGPVDFAATAGQYRLVLSGFDGSMRDLGGTASIQILPRWSVHLGGTWDEITARGMPDLSDVSPYLVTVNPDDLDDWADTVRNSDLDLAVDAWGATVRVASDVRFNRRDTLVLQARALVWSDLDAEVELPPVAGIDVPYEPEYPTRMPVRDAYVASAAWHMSWNHLELRLGLGSSSYPGAWLLQSTELAWRFGGHTRWEEARMRRTWKRNADDIEGGDGDFSDYLE